MTANLFLLVTYRKGSIVVSFLLFLESENRIITNQFLKKVVEKAMKNESGITYFGSYPIMASNLSISKINIFKSHSTITKLETTSTWMYKTTIKKLTNTNPTITAATTRTISTPSATTSTPTTTAEPGTTTDYFNNNNNNNNFCYTSSNQHNISNNN